MCGLVISLLPSPCHIRAQTCTHMYTHIACCTLLVLPQRNSDSTGSWSYKHFPRMTSALHRGRTRNNSLVSPHYHSKDTPQQTAATNAAARWTKKQKPKVCMCVYVCVCVCMCVCTCLCVRVLTVGLTLSLIHPYTYIHTLTHLSHVAPAKVLESRREHPPYCAALCQ